ncbi:MAG: CarD family transcriptional regulator [Halobacteriovoraceae bacterium]|nr:CarD family transcriptional regulator [Halobacteriovoraceae bacterium]
MFEIGDYAVCPGHGVGQVVDKVDEILGNASISLYVVKIISDGLIVRIPIRSRDGIRKLVTPEEISEVYGLLNNHDVKVDNSTWNRRHRDYLNKIKTGSLLEIADVLRSLFLLKEQKNLSYGEKKMLGRCKDLLTEEIALSKGTGKDEVDQKIESIFTL